MYLNRAKKAIEQQDQREFDEKRSKHAEREEAESFRVESSCSNSESRLDEFKPEELPDGSCFRPRIVSDGSDDGQAAVKSAEVCGFLFLYSRIKCSYRLLYRTFRSLNISDQLMLKYDRSWFTLECKS